MKPLESPDEEDNRTSVTTHLSMQENEFVVPQFKKSSFEENTTYLKEVNESSSRYPGI
jgi:hypothetical protein